MSPSRPLRSGPWPRTALPGPRRLVALLALACAGAAAAPGGLSLVEAFEQAWQRQPAAQSQAARRQAADAAREASRAWTPQPAALEAGWRSDRLQRRQGAQELELGVALPLWLAGERAQRRALAEAEHRLAQAHTELARWQLAQTLRERWWQLQQERAASQAAQERQRSDAQLALDVARRVQAGELSRADGHQAEAAAAGAAAEAALAAARQAAAEQQLRALLGLAAEQVLTLSEGPEPEPETEAPPQDPTDSAHPLLAALAAQLDRARQALQLARLQTREHPELTLQQSRERDARGEPSRASLRLGLRLPLGRGDAQRAELGQAGAELIEAEVTLARERERLQAEQRAAHAALQAARLVVQHQATRERLATETLGFVERAFRLGEADLPTRLRVAQEAASARRELAGARIALNLAHAQLRQALGLLPQ